MSWRPAAPERRLKAMPVVSIVIPVHNGAAFLDAAICSVRAQSFGEWELLLVDDGSTDATPTICAAAAAAEARVRVLSKPNSGISEALNLGLAEARGTWIARLDADDLMERDRLARQLAFLAAAPRLGGASSFYTVIDRDGRPRQQVRPLPVNERQIEALFARGGTLRYTHPTVTYRRDLARALDGYRRALEPCEDADLFLRFYEAGRPILVQPEFLTRYRVHPAQITAGRLHESFDKLHFIHDAFFRRRAGLPERGYAAFLEEQGSAPLSRRLRRLADYGAEFLHRRSTALMATDRPLAGLACLAGAGALRPMRAARRLLRR